MRRPNRRPNYTKTEDIQNWEIPPDYIIYKDDADTVAVNGDTGKEDSRNTDSATVINAVLSAKGNDTAICFKPGEYDITTDLSCTYSDIALYAEAYGSVTFNLAADVTDLLKVGGTAIGGAGFRYRNTIKNIVFNNDGGSGTYTGNYITAEYISDLNIINCRFNKCKHRALYIRTVHDLLVDNCWFKSNGSAAHATVQFVAMSASDNYKTVTAAFRDCVFEEGHWREIYCNESYLEQLKFNCCYFEVMNSHPSNAFIYVINPYVFIEQCYFYGADLAGFYAIYQDTSYVMHVTDCFIHNCTQGIYAGGQRVKISMCDFLSCISRCVHLVNGIIEHNIIQGFGNASGVNERVFNITSNSIIQGNIIRGGVNLIVGMHIDGDNNIISGNRIHVDGGSVGFGIRTDGAANNNLIENNYIDPTVGNEIAAGGTGDIVRHNEGWVTENSGTDTITATTKTVAHGLNGTPTVINICWRENPTVSVGDWWVDTIGAANFVLNVATDPGASDLDFGWEAKVR